MILELGSLVLANGKAGVVVRLNGSTAMVKFIDNSQEEYSIKDLKVKG